MGEPAREYRWPQATKGNQIARTHGFFAADVADDAASIVGELFDEETVGRYPALTLVFAEVFVRWQRARADIARRGQTLGEGDSEKPHPLLSHAARCEATMLSLSERFGLDPRSEWTLQRDRADAVRSNVDLEAVRRAGAEARERAAVTATASPVGDEPSAPVAVAETATEEAQE